VDQNTAPMAEMSWLTARARVAKKGALLYRPVANKTTITHRVAKMP